MGNKWDKKDIISWESHNYRPLYHYEFLSQRFSCISKILDFQVFQGKNKESMIVIYTETVGDIICLAKYKYNDIFDVAKKKKKSISTMSQFRKLNIQIGLLKNKRITYKRVVSNSHYLKHLTKPTIVCFKIISYQHTHQNFIVSSFNYSIT